MRDYIVDSRYIVRRSSDTAGFQEKYMRNGYWYKIDKFIGEGKIENFVSKMLRCSTLPYGYYVYYEYCRVNSKIGCRSKTFLSLGECFMSYNELYRYYCNGKLQDRILSLRNSKERLDYILKFIKKSTGLNVYNYLKTIILLDMLISNRDRHFGNLGVIYNQKTGRFRVPPIFDNGLAGGVGLGYDEVLTSCTLSGSFEDQVLAFGYPIVSTFRVDYERVYRETNVSKYPIVLSNLEKYKTIFRR